MSMFRFPHAMMKRALCALVCGALACLLVACGSVGTTTASGNPTPTATATTIPAPSPTSTPTPSPTPVPLFTSCPPTGTARPAVLEPLKLGTDASAVYTSDSLLIRYNTVTAQRVQILSSKPFTTQMAQVSPDGQWVLLFNTDPQQRQPSMLQLVRVDGQKLQTLYCAPASTFFSSIQWSQNQKSLLLETYDNNTNSNVITLLDAASGQLKAELQTARAQAGFKLVQWLDSTRAYVLKGYNQQQGPRSLYLLDVSKQHALDGSDLPKVQDFPAATGNTYNDINVNAINSDGLQLYIGQCHALTVEPTIGGMQQTIYRDTVRCILSVRVTTTHTLLFVTFTMNGSFGVYDLWKITTDGSGLVHISSNNGVHTYYGFNDNAPYPWSNAARDGKMVVIAEVGNMSGYNALLLFPTSGGKPVTVASGGPGTQIVRLDMVGWTTM